MNRNLTSMSLRKLTLLLNVEKHQVAVEIGNHIARQNKHSHVNVLTHDTRELEPFNEPHELFKRSPVGNQREALRRNMKYLGLVSCRNCATRFSDNGNPLDGKGRVYEDYKTKEKWCYVCGTRW